MKCYGIFGPRFAAGVLLGLAALTTCSAAQAYKYEINLEAKGMSGFAWTGPFFDNGEPSGDGPYTLRTTLLSDEVWAYNQKLDFYDGIVKLELVQGGVTYTSTRDLSGVRVDYKPFGSGGYGEINIEYWTKPQDHIISNMRTHLQLDDVGEVFSKFLEPEFSLTVNKDWFNSNAVITGNVRDTLWDDELTAVWENPASITVGTVVAVPEPSTYAMLLSGLAVAGTLAARRRRSTVALPVTAAT